MTGLQHAYAALAADGAGEIRAAPYNGGLHRGSLQ